MNGTRIEPLGPLGPGAPGRALLVLDHATGMQVAGKRLTPPAGVPVDRIRQEAMALGGGHPSINPVFDVVADGGAVESGEFGSCSAVDRGLRDGVA